MAAVKAKKMFVSYGIVRQIYLSVFVYKIVLFVGPLKGRSPGLKEEGFWSWMRGINNIKTLLGEERNMLTLSERQFLQKK